MKSRHSLAVVMGATTALSLIAVNPASAHESPSTTATVTATHPGQPLLGTFTGIPLDTLQAWATAVRARVAAVPDSTVLAGRARLLTVAKLASLGRLDARLAALDGLTAEQRAQVSAIRATLAATAADLRALLANRPVREPAHVTLVPTTATKTLATTTRHHCDGSFSGLFDRARYDVNRTGYRYDGYRWWDGYHRR